ncbi:hypothetical protein EFQ99_32075 [Rhizobium vallis]|uniref:Uncharacterized protein n=1 Tax=Rhizobium vallis TaxID=634290 RepID=A0A3S0QQG0_9HYPH|nr:hypothetical protein EFQ99_32075 [Rhizobium vallis]
MPQLCLSTIERYHPSCHESLVNASFVMLGLVPSICLPSIGQQILGTRPRMTGKQRDLPAKAPPIIGGAVHAERCSQ